MQNQITEGSILKPLLSFFFPILLGTFFQQLYNTVDAIIVGNFVGTAALGAVGGPTAVIINFLVNLFVGLSSGATVVIAQYYGARQGEELREAVHTGIALALAAGVVVTVVGLLVSAPVLGLMGTPEDVIICGSTSAAPSPPSSTIWAPASSGPSATHAAPSTFSWPPVSPTLCWTSSSW